MRAGILLVGCLALGSLSVSGCTIGAQGEVASGERLLAENKPGEALSVFQEILQGSDASPLDRQRAALGEARAFLAKGDLSGAETRFERLPNSQAAKFYYLGEIAQRRGERDEAIERFQRALEGSHGGDTAWRLATLKGCEARQPGTLSEAAGIARRGPFRAQAEALDTAAALWRKLDGGASPEQIRPELEAALAGLDPWPALCVLLARTSGEDADAAWELPDTAPEPTKAFRDYVLEVRAQGARREGDSQAVAGVIESATPQAARKIRAEVAASRLWRGDLEGALAVMQIGPQGARALALQTIYLELLGRQEEAATLRAKLAGGELGPQALSTGLLDPALARDGDALGVQARPPGTTSPLGPEVPQAPAQLRRLSRNAELIRRALWLHSLDASPDLRALILLSPSDPLVGALAEEDAQASGRSAEALASARLVRALRSGDLATAARLRAQVEDPSPWVYLSRGLRRALDAGRAEQARAFLATEGKKLPPDALNAALADESLRAATRALKGAGGVEAATLGSSPPWGAWVDSASRRRVPLVQAAGEDWLEPGGARTPRSELGGAPRFEGHPADADLASDPSLPPPRVSRSLSPQEVQ